MDGLIQDLRLATRTLLRSPGFTLAALLTIGLGVGATSTAFSLVNALFLRPPAGVAQPHRLVDVWGATEPGRHSWMVHSYRAYEDFQDHSSSFQGLAAHGLRPLSLSTGEIAERIFALAVSPNYFDVLGTRAFRGRTLLADDEQTIVLSHEFWVRRFASDPRIIGESVLINGQPLTVIGVAEPGFVGTWRGFGVQAWIPLPVLPMLTGREGELSENSTWLQITGRLRDGLTPEQATVELSALARRLAEGGGRASRATAVSLTQAGSLPGDTRGGVLGVSAGFVVLALLVLVIASVNVGGVLLARTASRAREVAIRMALGAGRRRVLRHLLTESSLLFVMGGGVGFVLAVWASHLLLQVPVPAGLPVHLDLSPDVRVFAFALLVAVSAGLLFGSGAAIRASGVALLPGLKGGALGSTHTGSRLRAGHVIGQVAVSLLLLVTAGLFLRALQRAHAVDLGFEPRGVVAATFDLEIQGYPVDRQETVYRQLLERAAELPGVERASLAWLIQLGLATATTSARIDGEPVQLPYNAVGPDYFATLRIPVIVGREFTWEDRREGPEVAVVNRELAERHWPRAAAIGRTIDYGGRTLEVVGVVENSKHGSLGEPPQPFLYLPAFQRPRNPELTLLLRTTGSPSAILPLLRLAVDEIDPHLPMLDAATLTERIGGAVLLHRLAAGITGALGGLGLMLACLGLYGVLANLVAIRTREIGVRMALGARPSAIRTMVVRRGLRLVVAGLAIGTLIAIAATRLLAGLLFDVSPTDPVTFIGVPLLLLSVALLASYLPARRATRVDPMIALRAE